MQKPGLLILLILGVTSLGVKAQKADSVIVIYRNQKTVIPVPAYKSQSSISYSDSTRIIEIGVSQRKPGDISIFPQRPNDLSTVDKHKSTSKWFLQLEAGYVKGFTETDNEYVTMHSDVNPPSTLITRTHMTNCDGYQIRLHLQEKEFLLDKKKSFVSGFLLGFSQNFLEAKQIYEYIQGNFPPYLTEQNFDFNINSFHFMYQFGIRYHVTAWKLPVKINVGNNLGFSVTRIIDKNDKMQTSYSHLNTTLLQPYLGMEISKIGILFAADMNVPHKSQSILTENDMGRSIALSITYSLF